VSSPTLLPGLVLVRRVGFRNRNISATWSDEAQYRKNIRHCHSAGVKSDAAEMLNVEEDTVVDVPLLETPFVREMP